MAEHATPTLFVLLLALFLSFSSAAQSSNGSSMSSAYPTFLEDLRFEFAELFANGSGAHSSSGYTFAFSGETADDWTRDPSSIGVDECILYSLDDQGPTATFVTLLLKVSDLVVGEQLGDSEASGKIDLLWRRAKSVNLTFEELMFYSNLELVVLESACNSALNGAVLNVTDLGGRRRLESSGGFWEPTIDVLKAVGASTAGGFIGSGKAIISAGVGYATAALGGPAGPLTGLIGAVGTSTYLEGEIQQFADTAFENPIWKETFLKSARGSEIVVGTATLIGAAGTEVSALRQAFKRLPSIPKSTYVKPTDASVAAKKYFDRTFRDYVTNRAADAYAYLDTILDFDEAALPDAIAEELVARREQSQSQGGSPLLIMWQLPCCHIISAAPSHTLLHSHDLQYITRCCSSVGRLGSIRVSCCPRPPPP